MSEAVEWKQLAPVLTVEAIEPCLPFWSERLGFTVAGQVPAGDAIAFAMLIQGNVHVMYQSRKSVADDLKNVTPEDLNARTMLYVSVSDIDAVERALQGVEIVVPRRKTFYGATEVAVREPGGNIVVFAEHDA